MHNVNGEGPLAFSKMQVLTFFFVGRYFSN